MTFIVNSDLRGSSFTEVHGSQYNIQTVDLTEEKALATLKPAVRGGYDVPVCMEGTRKSVFREVDTWLDDLASTPNTMWISGSPGAGKSAIASTLVSNLTRRRRPFSFFFFKRGDAILGDPGNLWRTVASDLCKFNTDLKACVVDFLRTEIRDGDIMLHFDCMIKEPLARNHAKFFSEPPVVIIDALDECGLDDTQAAQRRILLDTLTRWSHLPTKFKLILTSRNERLPSSFHDQRVCRRIVLETGESVTAETRKDIRIFFEKSFDDICPEIGMASTWPGKLMIDRLTERAGGLFIWAKTAIAFVKEKRGEPVDKLKLLLAGNLGKGNDTIDRLYRQILDFSFDDVDDITLELFKAIVGMIIIAKTPLHRDDLKHFLARHDNQHERQFNIIFRNLSSVLEFDGWLRLRHLSFAEFLVDPNRCRDHRFIIDQNELHHNMAFSCLRIMKRELKFNICALETSHLRNDDVVGLAERIAAMVPTRLQYSCRFWAAHLCDTAVEQGGHKPLLKEVTDFFHIRLLYWLEVMSLIKEVSASLIVMLSVARSQGIKDVDAEVSDFAKDASQFIINFYTPISESVPHIYLSALPFSPRKSLISRQFSVQCPDTLSVVMGQDEHWPPLINMLTGHTDDVWSVAFSPDGKHIVSGSSDNTVRVWNVETGQIVARPFEGHTDPVLSVAYSPDGKHVVSGSSDNTVRVWDAETGQIVAGPFEGHTHSILPAPYSPDGKHVVSGSSSDSSSSSSNDAVRVWDAETSQIVASPIEGYSSSVSSVAYSPDGKHVVSGSWDKIVRVWDVETGQIAAFEGHTKSVSSVAYSPDGKHIVSGSKDNTVRVWDVKTGQIVAAPFQGHTGSFLSVAYSPNGKHVVSGSSNDTVCVWDAETGQIIAGPFEGHTESVSSVAYSLDGKRSSDNTVRVWNVETGEIAAGPFEGHTEPVLSVAYSPDGKHVVSGSSDNTVRVWDVETGQIVAGPSEGHTDSVWSVTYSPDGKHVVSGSEDKTVRAWDVETGRIVSTPFEGHTDSVWSVTYSPDGKHILSGSEDKTVRMWDVKTGQTVAAPFEGHTDSVLSVACSPDGKHIVLGSKDMTVCVWDVETGQVVAGPFEGHTDSVSSVAYSPRGKHVVSGSSDSTVRVWRVKTGEIKASPFEGHTDSVSSVAYSPDGKCVVSGSWDMTVCVWDVKTGQIVAGPFEGHANYVFSVAYSPDGKHVVSGSEDMTVRVWDVKTGHTVAGPFEGHIDPVWSVAYSPDGKHVVSGSSDNTVRIWDVGASQIVAGPFEDCTHSIPPVADSPDGKHAVSGSYDMTLRVQNIETVQLLPVASNHHIVITHSIGGPNAFSTGHLKSNGWTHISTVGNDSVLFWVPLHARPGLCDGRTVLVLGVCNTRLDLSRFVHGTSWIACHPHPFVDMSTSLPLLLHDVKPDLSPQPPRNCSHLKLISLLLIPLIAMFVFYLSSN